MGILNIKEYKRRLESGNPVTIEELENELKVLIKEMIETATQGEITSHLGYEKNKKSDNSNYRNGYSKKTLKSKYGEIEVNIPRDRNSTFEPKLVKKKTKTFRWDGRFNFIFICKRNECKRYSTSS